MSLGTKMSGLIKEKLLRRLEAIAEDFNGVMGISVKDLVSGDEFNINENEVFPVASSIKIPLLIEFFRQAKSGMLELDSKITIQEGDKTKGSGVLKELGDGTVTLTLRDIATLMIIVSDNTATNILIDKVGMDDVNHLIQELGLLETKLRSKMQDYHAASIGQENISTPHEFMRLMECLFMKKELDSWVCEQTLSVLKKNKITPISRGLPVGIEIANKPGGMMGVSCDIAIVFQPNRPYVIVIMTKNIPLSDTKKLIASERMTEVSRMVYEYFRFESSSNIYGMIVPETELK
jgi:beta-lactamase class A